MPDFTGLILPIKKIFSKLIFDLGVRRSPKITSQVYPVKYALTGVGDSVAFHRVKFFVAFKGVRWMPWEKLAEEGRGSLR